MGEDAAAAAAAAASDTPEASQAWRKLLVVGMDVDVDDGHGTSLHARITAAVTPARGYRTGGLLRLSLVGSSDVIVIGRFSERLSPYEPPQIRGRCPLCTWDVTTKHNRTQGTDGVYYHQACYDEMQTEKETEAAAAATTFSSGPAAEEAAAAVPRRKSNRLTSVISCAEYDAEVLYIHNTYMRADHKSR